MLSVDIEEVFVGNYDNAQAFNIDSIRIELNNGATRHDLEQKGLTSASIDWVQSVLVCKHPLASQKRIAESYQEGRKRRLLAIDECVPETIASTVCQMFGHVSAIRLTEIRGAKDSYLYSRLANEGYAGMFTTDTVRKSGRDLFVIAVANGIKAMDRTEDKQTGMKIARRLPFLIGLDVKNDRRPETLKNMINEFSSQIRGCLEARRHPFIIVKKDQGVYLGPSFNKMAEMFPEISKMIDRQKCAFKRDTESRYKAIGKYLSKMPMHLVR